MRGEASYENTLRLSREAKRRRTGTCRVCGVTTRYSGQRGRAVSDICLPCAAREAGERRRGTGENTARILALLTEPRRVSEICDELGISRRVADATLHRMVSYGLVERVSRGVYCKVEQ